MEGSVYLTSYYTMFANLMTVNALN